MTGTTLRFVALVIAVLGTATYAFSSLYYLLPERAAAGGVTYARCTEAYRHALPAPDVDLDGYVAASERAQQEMVRCLAPFEQAQAMWVLAGLAVLLAVATVLFLTTPGWIRRRGRLVEITSDRFPRLHAELVRLSTIGGLPGPPTFLLDPAAGSPGGLAFGRTGGYSVRINAGLVPLSVTDPGVFRAVVLHELAHLRNRDVDLAYAAVALWRAFAAVALVPLVVMLLYPTMVADGRAPWDTPGYGSTLVHVGGRAVLFVAVAYLARNAVLRAREMYADSRVAEFGAAVDLHRAVTLTATPRAGRSWLRRFGVHPTVAARLAAIEDPARRHRPGFGEHFLAGLTTVVAFSGLSHYAVLAVTHDGSAGPHTAAWAVGPVVTGILGAAAWRAQLVPGSSGDRTRTVVVAALGFSLGWLVGDLTAITSALGSWGIFGSPWTGGQVPVGDGATMSGFGAGSALLAALLLTGGMLAQAGVSAAGARTWSARGVTGRFSWALGAAVTAVPFAIWIGVWHPVHMAPYLVGHPYSIGAADLAHAGVDIWQGPGFAVLTLFYPPLEIFQGRPLAAPVVALAWLYPLAAALWGRRRCHRRSAGRRLDGPEGSRSGDETPRSPVPSGLGLGEGVRTALRVAVIGAAGFAVAVLAARAALRLSVPTLVSTDGFPGYFYYAQSAAAGLVQAVVGGVLAARGRPLGLILGQLGAAIVAVLATVAVLAGQTLGGCVPAFRFRGSSCDLPDDLPWTLRLLAELTVKGALFALLAGVAATVLRATVHRLPARLVLHRPAARWACSTALLAVLPLVGGGLLRATYISGKPIAPAAATPAAPPATPAHGRPGRTLTSAEVTAAAEAAARGLPPHWERKPQDEQEKTSAPPRYDPTACKPLATDAFLEPLARDERAVARLSLSNGGRLASSSMTVTVVSYASVVPDTVLHDAERARAACSRFRITNADDFQLNYHVHAAAPPRLGDQAWRVDYDLSTVTGPTIRARMTQASVRIDHTLVTISMTAIEEPLDQALLLTTMTRVLAALPH
ncbi:M48 family metalloprotease [Micromonospora fulviviridis]|uniref:M48 family metalloprotease n=1 Tax=Micromonospora fulviviridis TaxID=47860 RepID=A0ABV2VUC3_9ACTN